MQRTLIILTTLSLIASVGIIISLLISPENPMDNSIQIPAKNVSNETKIGNFFDNNLKSGMTSTKLELSNQKASIRFTNTIPGQVSNVTLAVSSKESQTVIIGLQEDDGHGQPTGEWINGVSVHEKTEVNKLDHTFIFPQKLFLKENQVYHIVIQSENSTSDNYLKIKNYQTNSPYLPYNPYLPDTYFPDHSINSLFFDGQKWIEQGRWPAFLISFDDGKKIGQPYTLAAGWVIRDKTWVGQTFIPSADYKVSKIAFVVSKQGDPDEPLSFGIKDEDNNMISNGVFADSLQLSSSQKWIEISLDKPIILEAQRLYRIFLYSKIPYGEEFYRVYGHEYSFDYDIGYGALRHSLTISHDFGDSWSTWADADTIFKLTT